MSEKYIPLQITKSKTILTFFSILLFSLLYTSLYLLLTQGSFTATYGAFMEFAFDYIEDVSIPFMNFVERDMTTFVSGGSNELQLSYPQMYFNVIGKVMGYENAGRQNTIIASQMILCVLHFGRGPTWPNPPPTPLPPGIGASGGKVDAWLGPSLTLALTRLQTATHGSLKGK